MKQLFTLVALVAIGFGVYKYVSQQGSGGPSKPSVHIGATVEEVEQVFGAPLSVLPNFGRELRTYKAKSGTRYILIFEDGKVTEIQQ